MSGSGSGSGGDGSWRPTGATERSGQKPGGERGGSGSGKSGDACDITEVTTLNSPNRTTVTTLRVGDILDVQLQAGPPRRLVATHNGSVAGSITSPKSTQIIQCITREGRAYVAEVRSIRGGLCQVELRPR
jgi:hypothetical protein